LAVGGRGTNRIWVQQARPLTERLPERALVRAPVPATCV